MTVAASPRMNLLIDQAEQQLGYAFEAKLVARGMQQNLSSIDLSPLRKNFGVVIEEYSGTTGDTPANSEQRLLMTLFPRRPGKLQVPALNFSGATASHYEVTVLPARGPAGAINLDYHLSNARPWQREQLLVTVHVSTPDKFARLEIADEQDPDYEIRTIPATKETRAGTTRLGSGWIIFPLQSGLQSISLPPVLYPLQGTVERRFYLPDIQLNVKSLPRYIPPLMPVGQVFIESEIDTGHPLTTGQTYDWNIRLHSPALLSHFLPPVLRQIGATNTTRFLAARSKRSEDVSHRGSHAEVVHTVPFQPLRTGPLRLPELRGQYFDPVAGRGEVAEYQPPQKWSIALYWKLLLGAGLLLAVVLLTRAGRRYWLCWRMRRGYMREAIEYIGAATTDRQLRQALHLIARAENWPANLSIKKWNEYWNRQYSPPATSVMESLSIACYARGGTDTVENRVALLKLVNSRQSNRRFLQVSPG